MHKHTLPFVVSAVIGAIMMYSGVDTFRKGRNAEYNLISADTKLAPEAFAAAGSYHLTSSFLLIVGFLLASICLVMMAFLNRGLIATWWAAFRRQMTSLWQFAMGPVARRNARRQQEAERQAKRDRLLDLDIATAEQTVRFNRRIDANLLALPDKMPKGSRQIPEVSLSRLDQSAE